jgi:eukaryotic-like serine/threonine-protein kinase
MSSRNDRDRLFRMMAERVGLTDAGAATEGDYLDADVRQAVETLVSWHLKQHGGSVGETLASVGGTIEKTLSYESDATQDAGAASPRVADAPATAGDRFRVLRPHARGGLGAVFVALDQELNREVALKQIIEKLADNPVSRARFLLEAEITGGLEHPGIVPVYGLGLDAGGRPYYAMRFIRGDTLEQAVDRFYSDAELQRDPGARSLALRQLLRRFVDICNAIDYAHSRGVLHRDIKPANIIVGRHGETLVVDWGLAKAVGRGDPGNGSGERILVPSLSSGTAETLPGSSMGTPAFMSPEQADGDLEQLGTRSDIYSLGATLYYIVTGQTSVSGTVLQMLEAVKRGDITPPRRHDPRLDRVLEAIVLKAMARRPEDRYATPRALAEDLERWMADEPVSAWPDPWTRTLLRWLTRHRTGVTAAAASMLASVVGLAAILALQARANAQITTALRHETQANVALAAANEELGRSKAAVQARYDLAVDAIKTFHTGVSEDFLLKEDQFKDLRDRLLRSASEFYARLGALLGHETDLASRRALASANFELAGLTAKVGRLAEALASQRAVLEARRAIAAERGSGDAARADVGRSLTEVAALLELAGKTDDALAEYREAEGVLSGPAGDSPEARAALASCRSRMGFFLSTIGKNDEALAAYRQARDQQEAMAAAAGAPAEVRRDLADTINRIGRVLQNIGRPAEAEAAYRQALSLRRGLVDRDPASSSARDGVAASHNNVGLVLWKTGRYREAEDELRAAQALWRTLANDNPAVASFRTSLQMSQVNLGNLLKDTGRLRESEDVFGEALAGLEQLVASHPTVPDYRRRLALAHQNLGLVLRSEGRPQVAEPRFRASLAILADLVAAHPAVTDYRADLGSSHSELGVLLAESGRLAGAEAEFRASAAIGGELVAANPKVTVYRDRLATSRVNLGELLGDAGRPADAEPEYRAAEAIFHELVRDNPAVDYFSFGLAYTLLRRGILLMQVGRPAEAEPAERQAAEIYAQLAAKSPGVPDYRDGLATALANLGNVMLATGQAAEARNAYDRAITAGEKLVEENPKSSSYRVNLAGSLRRRGLAVHAQGDVRRALAILDGLKTRAPTAWFETACCHATLGDAPRAVELLGRAARLGYRNPYAYRAETALAPLRDRDDFRLLMMDLDFPAEAFVAP